MIKKLTNQIIKQMTLLNQLLAICGVLMSSLLMCGSIAMADQYKSFMIVEKNNANIKALNTPELLEKNLSKISQSQQALAQRFLARHFVEKKQYQKAISFYQESLQNDDLSIFSKQQLLDELSIIYMFTKQYKLAISTLDQYQQVSTKISAKLAKDNTKITNQSTQKNALPTQNNKRFFDRVLIRAQAYFYLGQYNKATTALHETFNEASLDRLTAKINSNDTSFVFEKVDQALSLFYAMQAFPQAVDVLNYLIKISPKNKSHWQMLTHVYMKMEQQQKALDTLVLAEAQLTPSNVSSSTPDLPKNQFEQSSYDWLIALYVNNQLYFQAAQKQWQLMQQKLFPQDDKAYYQLFNLWYHAKEITKAQQALAKSAELSQKAEHFIQLAQLQLQQNNWLQVETAVLSACKIGLNDKLIGKANLLLGVQYAHRGERILAKQAFTNANYIGGSIEESAKWLRYLNNGEVDENFNPYGKFNGPCIPRSEKNLLSIVSNLISPTQPLAKPKITVLSHPKVEKITLATQFKTLPRMTFYGLEISTSKADFGDKLLKNIFRLYRIVMRKGGKIKGPLHIIYQRNEKPSTSDELVFTLALPINGSMPGQAGVRSFKTTKFYALTSQFEGKFEDVVNAWQKLLAYAKQEQLIISGENRQLFMKNMPDGYVQLELQLGLLNDDINTAIK